VSRDYELGFILNPEVSEEETRSILDRVEQIVANYDGQVFKVNHWGRRRLAYPIDHHRDGYYIFIDMILTPEAVAEIERTLRVSEIVLRYMMKRRDPKTVQKEREARAAVAAAQAEATNQPAAPAAPAMPAEPLNSVDTTSNGEIPVTPAETASQPETPVEALAEIAPVSIVEEESVVLPSDEAEGAPAAVEIDIESPETIEA
jgi:small subunit ribosomal protein S6